jgi:hypothetical protein
MQVVVATTASTLVRTFSGKSNTPTNAVQAAVESTPKKQPPTGNSTSVATNDFCMRTARLNTPPAGHLITADDMIKRAKTLWTEVRPVALGLLMKNV